MKVVWTEEANRCLAQIYDYIARDSMTYAKATVERILAREEQIAEFPQSGRQVPEYPHPQLREVREGSYRIIYRIGVERIEVIAVVHAARDLRP